MLEQSDGKTMQTGRRWVAPHWYGADKRGAMTDDTAPDQPSRLQGVAQALPLFYANQAGLRPGPFDIALDFGYLAAGAEGEPPAGTQWIARVAMSWEHARALHDLLGEQIRNYEENVGPLPDISRLKVEDAD